MNGYREETFHFLRQAMRKKFECRLEEEIDKWLQEKKDRGHTEMLESIYNILFPSPSLSNPSIGHADWKEWKELLKTTPIGVMETIPKITQEDLEKWKQEDERKKEERKEVERIEALNLKDKCARVMAQYGGK